MKTAVFFTFLCVVSGVLSASFQEKNRIDTRIIGGSLARAGEFPFIASFIYQTELGYFFCAGSIIAPEWILTAGQCVNNVIKFNISVGAITLNDPDFNRVNLQAKNFVLHPNYDELTLENDIGLIQLDKPVLYSDYIKPVFLPSADLQFSAKVIALGWGQTDDMHPGPVNNLHQANVATMQNQDCQQSYTDKIFDTMVCAEGNFNEGTCIGDMGGPLVRYVLNARHIEVVAVASFISPNGCESLSPSGFTKVFPYVSWIQSTIST